MEVVLLERVEKLGQMGDVVKVKNGYARNFLLPRKKALRATKANLEYFETQKVEIEARNLERRNEAEAVAEKLNGASVVAIRQSSEAGNLYGSVAIRDIAELLAEQGFSVERSQVVLNAPIKTLGVFDVRIQLHGEVDAHVSVNVARSAEEAERQAAGEDVTAKKSEEEETLALAEEVFESEELAKAAQAELEEKDEAEEPAEEADAGEDSADAEADAAEEEKE